MRYLSLFSGIEAASVAWEPLGWEPVAFSEIDAFPSAILSRRYPDVANLGDITQIDWSEHNDCNTADLVVGGSPCQSFSIAGRREGLQGASGLMWEYVRAIQTIRPRWIVWENVPGALSSSHGEDFGCLLRALDGFGYGLAWRVLDSQYFGVAQRRRRVFLVGSLGDQRSCEVLFESDCLRRDHPSGRTKRQDLSRAAEIRVGCPDETPECLTPWDVQSRRIYDPAGPWPALYAGEGGGHGYVFVARPATTQGAPGRDDGRSHRDGVGVARTRACSQEEGVVRRLTPVECERLQGFPDDWTDVPYRGREHSPDGLRYKAIGNSMAVPVMRWIGSRIQRMETVGHE